VSAEFGLAPALERLSSTVGVIEHTLFPPEMVSDVLVARGEEVEHIAVTPIAEASQPRIHSTKA
jgi:hypothetical protein